MTHSVTNPSNLAKVASAIVLAFTMFVFGLGWQAQSAWAAEDASQLAAGGVTLDAQGLHDVTCILANPSSGSINWDSATNTVTMTNATIDMSKQLLVIVSAINIDGAGVYPTPTVTLKLEGSNTITGDDDLTTLVRVEKANLRLAGTGSLTINSNKSLYLMKVDGNFSAPEGQLTLVGGSNGLSCEGDIDVCGSSITVENSKNTGIQGQGSVTLRSGKVAVKSASYRGISAQKGITVSGATVEVNNVKGYALYSSDAPISASSGTVSIKNCDSGLYSSSSGVSLTGAKVSMSSITDYGIRSSQNISMKSGRLVVDDSNYAIYGLGGMTVNGGTIIIQKARSGGISVDGKLNIKKGTLTVKCESGNSYALYAKSISNKPKSLKTISGRLGKGAKFKSGGSIYAVSETYLSEAILKSYGGKSKKPSLASVTYGKHSYDITGIAAKAFANKKGKAVTALTLGWNIRAIGKNAFAGTTKLKTLDIKKFPYYLSSLEMTKKSFSKCGKGGGKQLTVRCASVLDRKSAREALTGWGLSKKAKFV